MPPQDVFPFFTGCQRSGTTLIREIFRAHPQLAIPRESHFIPEVAERRRRYERGGTFDAEAFLTDLGSHERFQRWGLSIEDCRAALRATSPSGLADAIREVFAVFARTKGKPLYADKTPRYATRIPLLADLFPEARFVHVIRDGRDVALSVLEMPWGPTRLDKAALYWRERVEAAREAGAVLGPARYLEYKHEDLVADPEREVRRLCTFLALTFEPEMLRYHEHRRETKQPQGKHLTKPPTAGLRNWRTQMAPGDAATFEALAGDVLADLGYEVSGAPAPGAWVRAKGAKFAHDLGRSPAGGTVRRVLKTLRGRRDGGSGTGR